MATATERTSLTSAARQTRRRTVLETVVEGPRRSPSGGGSLYVPSPDAAAPGDCEPWGRTTGKGYFIKRQGTTIFDDTFEQTLKEEHPEAHQALSATLTGYLIQVFCLCATVFAYTAGPLFVQWAKTTGWTENGKRKTGNTFLEPMAVLITKCLVVLIGVIFALISDRRKGGPEIEGGYLRRIFNPHDLLRWAPIALGWSVADVAEVMAQGRSMDPATYTILSQSRLVGTAIVMRIVSGTQRSVLQWSILTTLTLVIVGWKMMPDEFGKVKGAKDTSGQGTALFLTFLKVFLSIICGVFSQGILKGSAHLPLIIQQTQICFCSALWTSLVLILSVCVIFPTVFETPWDYPGSIFGGEPNENGMAGFAAFRAWIVIMFYIYREYTVNLCVKNFDVLIKNLCNAFAAVLSYYVMCLFMGDKPFNAVKGLFTIVIGMEIVHYAMAPPPPPPVELATPEDAASGEKASKLDA